MKKLIIWLAILLPTFANAQVNGTIQKTASSGVVRGNFGSGGADTIVTVRGVSVNGQLLQYNSTYKKWIPYTPSAIGSTGIISGGVMTGTGASNLIVSAGTGTVLDNTTPASPSFYNVSWSTDTIGLTDNSTNYIYVTSGGVIMATTVTPTPQDYRTRIYLGRAQKISGAITSINGDYVPVQQSPANIDDMFKAYGLAKTGLAVTPDSINLKIDVGSGDIFGFGINFSNSVLSPNNISYSAVSKQTFRMVTSGNISTTNVTDLPVGFYNPTGTTVSAIGGGANESSIFTVYKFPTTGNVRILYGNTTYASLSAAVTAIGTYVPTPPAVFRDAIILGYIAAVKNATNLSNTTQAVFVTTNKFGLAGMALASSALTNYVPNSRLINSGYGLTGGGDLSNDRTLAVDTTAIQTVANFFPKGDTRYLIGTGTIDFIPLFNGNKSQRNSVIRQLNNPNAFGADSTIYIGGIPTYTQRTEVLHAVKNNTGLEAGNEVGDIIITNDGRGGARFVAGANGNDVDTLAYAYMAAHGPGEIYPNGMDSRYWSGGPKIQNSIEWIHQLNKSATLIRGLDSNKDFYFWNARSDAEYIFQYATPTPSRMFLISDTTNISYKPFKGLSTITGSSFSGAGTGLTGTATGLSIGGNSGSVTNGVYTVGNQSIGGIKTFTSSPVISSGNALQIESGITGFYTFLQSPVGMSSSKTITLPDYTSTLYGTGTGSITSAQLATSLTDETGTGSAVFSASPSFTGTVSGANAGFTGGVNLATTSGNVGVGVASPLYKMHISADAADYGLVMLNPNANGYGAYIRGGKTDGTTTALDVVNSAATSLLSIKGNGESTFSGNVLAPNLTSGTYTPTLTNGSNVSSSTAGTGSYIRIGNQVTGYVDFIATGSSTALGDIGVSLPIASNFDSSTDVSGSLGVPRTGESTTSNGVAALNADTTNDRFAVVPSLVSGSPLTYRFHFQYTIK